jgi:hypothetical protein
MEPAGCGSTTTVWPRSDLTAVLILFCRTGLCQIFLTDHFVDVHIASVVTFDEIYQWVVNSQGQGAWVDYMHAFTPQQTSIVQIAASQSIQTQSSGTFGPSQLWGIDTNGHVFAAVPPAPGTTPK